jgi:cytochrome c551
VLNRSLLALVLAFTLAACGGKTDDGDGFGGGADDSGGDGDGGGNGTDGAEVFSARCASCHGADGSGNSGPNLGTVVPALSDDDLMDVIENGTGNMPALGLDADDADAVFEYVRTTFGEEGGG